MARAAVNHNQPLELEPPRPGSLEARASLALKGLAFINIAGVVLAEFPPPLPVSFLHTVAFNAAAAVLAVLQLVEARALDRRRPWAVSAARPLLVVLIATGLGATLVGVGEGWIRIPFESLLAIWALFGRADPTLIRRADRRSWSLVPAVAVVVAMMLVSEPVFGWGGKLDVRRSDLQASVTADCATSGTGPPTTITVTYDWAWTRTSPLPNGLDIVVLGWSGNDAAGRPVYLFDNDPQPSGGIYPGRRAYPSLDMATLVASESPASWSWGIELDEQGLRPGHIELDLRRARDAPPDPAPLVITATYIHLGLWRSEPATFTCTW
jgi:hypothetical protein